MDYVSISVRTQKQRGGGRGVHVLDADGFKLLPLFSIRHEAFTFLIFQTMRGGADVLGKWTVCISLTLGSSAFLFSLPPQGWDVGTLTVKPEPLRRLPLCCSCTPRCLWGCNYQSSHAIEVGHAYDPFCFHCCFCWGVGGGLFGLFFSIISNDTVWGICR